GARLITSSIRSASMRGVAHFTHGVCTWLSELRISRRMLPTTSHIGEKPTRTRLSASASRTTFSMLTHSVGAIYVLPSMRRSVIRPTRRGRCPPMRQRPHCYTHAGTERFILRLTLPTTSHGYGGDRPHAIVLGGHGGRRTETTRR